MFFVGPPTWVEATVAPGVGARPKMALFSTNNLGGDLKPSHTARSFDRSQRCFLQPAVHGFRVAAHRSAPTWLVSKFAFLYIALSPSPCLSPKYSSGVRNTSSFTTLNSDSDADRPACKRQSVSVPTSDLTPNNPTSCAQKRTITGTQQAREGRRKARKNARSSNSGGSRRRPTLWFWSPL